MVSRLVFGSPEANAIRKQPRPSNRQRPTPIPAAENTREPMSERERYAARALGTCTFRSASFDKRFARDAAALAREENPQLTTRQRATLWRLVYRYRRQIQDKALVQEAWQIVQQQGNEPPLPLPKG